MSGNFKQRMFFKDYESAVLFLKNVFYYGTKSQADFEREGIFKKSKYYDLCKTLRYVFGDSLIEKENRNGENALGIRTDHFYDPHRAFLKFFALKSFTSAGRLFLVCYILQMIALKGSCTILEIESSNSDLNHSTLNRTIKDMYENGLFTKEGSRYSIAMPAEKLKESDVLLLVDLCINAYPLSILGNGIINKTDLKYESPFLFKHLHLGNIFNDEIVWQLVAHACNKQHICIYHAKGTELHDLLPYRIITNHETGRQYVFVVYVGNDNYDEYLLIRLDRIKKIEAEKTECVIPDDNVLAEKYDTAFRYSFNGTNKLQRNQEPQEATIEYSASFEWNIKMHFPDCVPDTAGDGLKRVRVKVNSCIELKPWLWRHSREVRLVDSSDGTLNKMKDELTKWREIYELS